MYVVCVRVRVCACVVLVGVILVGRARVGIGCESYGTAEVTGLGATVATPGFGDYETK